MKKLDNLIPKRLGRLSTFKKAVFCFVILAVAIYVGAVVAYNLGNNPKTISASSNTAMVTSSQKPSVASGKSESKQTSTTSNDSSTGTTSDGKNIDLGCTRTDIVPYKTTYYKYDSMAAGQKETIVTGQNGYTTVCKYQKPDGTIAIGNKWSTDPINAVVDEGTGKDQVEQEQQKQQQQAAQQQLLLDAQNAGNEAKSTAYQNCVNQVAGTSLVQSWCPQVAQDAYNQAYNNYLSSH